MENATDAIITTENDAKITFAKNRLDREFQMLLKQNKLITNEYHIEKIDEMFCKVKIFNITNKHLLIQLKKLHLEYIEIGIRITKDYPYIKPFIWIIHPSFKTETAPNTPAEDNNLFAYDCVGEINNQIKWAPTYGVKEIVSQIIKLFDIKKWVIDENDIKNDVELEFLNKIIVNNTFSMLDKGYQLKDISLETLFQIQNDNDE